MPGNYDKTHCYKGYIKIIIIGEFIKADPKD